MPFLANAPIEILNPAIARGQVRFALFDFDGTLSLIREGWQAIMIPLMVEVLLTTPRHEGEAALTRHVEDLVGRTTGIQTIEQMVLLCREVQQRGGDPQPALLYKGVFLQRLGAHISRRLAGLKDGSLSAETLSVPGARRILAGLRQRSVPCYLASGTDEIFVRDEAAALGLAPYFAGIYGARDDISNQSKKMVIARLLAENNLLGPELVTFGDGFVEIEDTKAAGGIAVGVASDEVHRQGIDEWKRRRLIGAGADVIIPDFRCAADLLAYLFAEEPYALPHV